MQYTTADQDTVDYICWRHYGTTTGTVERVYRANPRLADHPLLLPAGITIELPSIPANELAGRQAAGVSAKQTSSAQAAGVFKLWE